MDCEFSERSLNVCRDFLQTAVIIDDRAFHKSLATIPDVAEEPRRGAQPGKVIKKSSPEDERALDAKALIKSFADHGIFCSALEFTDFKKNFTSFTNTARLADIAIIDWELEKEKTGKNALKLMSSLLEDDFSSPQRFRLLTIYTGHEDLADISNKVVDHVKKVHGKELSVEQEGLLLVNQSIVIAIYAKDPHNIPKQFQNNAVAEDGLPEKLVACFSKSISGILPNTALSAVTAIRQSTHYLLAKFNKNLDAAYLTHRVSLPKPDDAAIHLETFIAEEIKSILSSYECISKNASFSEIKKWTLERYPNKHEFDHPTGKKLKREDILEFLKEGCAESTTTCLTKGEKKKLYSCFSGLLTGEKKCSSVSDLSLSRLSVLKTRYQNSIPHLTMGIVLQQLKDKTMWLCIQPRCDSVRLKKGGMKFPLLPILPGIGSKSAPTLPKLLEEDIENFCHIPIHPQNCRSIEFKSARVDQSQVYPKLLGGEWIFLTNEKLRFKFVAELKDEISQNILNDFAATTARVGINPSEWLRKSGLEK